MLIPRLTTCTFETPAPCTDCCLQSGLGGEHLALERDTLFYVTTPCDIMMHVVTTELNYLVKVFWGLEYFAPRDPGGRECSLRLPIPRQRTTR
jgi:hypothetical protein